MDNRTKTIATGLAAGSTSGAAFAWVTTTGDDDADEGDSALAALGPMDYFQLGIAVLTLARQFGSMVKRT